MEKSLPKKQKNRMIFVAAAFLAVCVPVIITQLFNVQILKHEEYQTRAIEQQTRDAIVNPSRGTIFDRNLNELAVSATVETVVINPSAIATQEMAEAISKGLSEILGVSYDTIYKKTQARNYYEIIKRQVEKEDADRVRILITELKTRAIYMIEDTKRYYPGGSLASAVVGFTNIDGVGIEGLEAYYERALKGTAGRIIAAKNARGTDMPFEYQTYIEAQDGNGIVLTIDETIQHFTEKYLEQAMIDANVKGSGTAIVMNVKTGEILSMAIMPNYDLNNPRTILDTKTLEKLSGLTGEEYNKALLEAWQSLWRNGAISDTYEPGSIFKLITASAGLEEGVVTVDTRFTCTGGVKVGDRTIHCWRRIGHGAETFAQGLQNSCNPVFIATALMLGPQKFYDYCTAFGFREKTGIDLYGESSGILHSFEVLSNPVSLAVAAFGQTFKVTPIQMITAISAIVNGGYLMEPQIVKAVVDSNGKTIESFEPVVKRQVISEKTSKTMAALMESVVSVGTGKNAYIKGYRVGGKTATSEKVDAKNEAGVADKRIASFVGIAPADDPVVAVLVVLDEPDMPTVSGGALAGPVVRNILTDILPYLGVTPVYTAEEIAAMGAVVADYSGMTIAQAQAAAKASGHALRIMGSGGTVLSQMPHAGQQLVKNGTVILYTDKSTTIKVVTVPDLTNLTITQAAARLEALGLNIEVAGNYMDGDQSRATQQLPAAGSEVGLGSIITVEFTNTDLIDDSERAW